MPPSIEPDQSIFVEQQAAFQAPPEVLRKKQDLPRVPRSPLYTVLIVFGVILVLLIVAGILYKTFWYRPALPPTIVAPSPTPIVVEQTELEKALNTTGTLLEESNPYGPVFAPPPVDMNVRF